MPKTKLFLVGLGLALIGFFLHFPLIFKTQQFIQIQKEKLQSGPCPTTWSQMKFSFWPLGLRFQDVEIRGHCTGAAPLLALPKVAFRFRGPSFFPLGVKFSSQIPYKNGQITGHGLVSLSQSTIRLENSTLHLADLGAFFPYPLILSGDIQLNAVIQMTPERLQSADVRMSSQNLKSIETRAVGIELPAIELAPATAELSMEGQNDLQVRELKLGRPGGDVYANFRGRIRINPAAALLSEINATGALKLSEDLMNEFGIVRLFLKDEYKKDDGLYHIKLSGQLASPQIEKAP